MQGFDWNLVAPAAILAAFGLLALLLAPFFRGSSWIPGSASAAGLVLAGFQCARLWTGLARSGAPHADTAAGMVRVDHFGLAFSFIVLAVALMSLVVSMRMLEREGADRGEFHALFLFAVSGMLVMLHTQHLMVVLVGLEIFSLSLYVLCGITRFRTRSIESALKYFLLGAFSSGFLVYGLALIYGAAGTLDMAGVRDAVAAGPTPILWLGLGLVVVGFAFKIAVVPFHHWVPDVYQGAPTNVTGFMAAATKTVAIAALLRLLLGSFGGERDAWVPLIAALAILTMVVANLVALAQTNIKRLLAFSSIAHAGYLLIAVVCQPAAGVQAIVYYLTTYAFMTVGAFAVVAAVGRTEGREEVGYDLASWAGLGRTHPALAAMMTVFLLSMAGMPPTGGFLGKYLIFKAAVESKEYLLAVIGVLAAVVAAYYYLKIVMAMWMTVPEGEPANPTVTWETTAVLAVATVVIFVLGLVPAPLLAATRRLGEFLL
jgi:NADH-quinone oxidoreductase subunit N